MSKYAAHPTSGSHCPYSLSLATPLPASAELKSGSEVLSTHWLVDLVNAFLRPSGALGGSVSAPTE